MMIPNADCLVFMDVETTGLDAQQERIIEVFLLKIARSGNVSEYETLIHPERPIPAVITEITGITDQDVAEAPTEAEVAHEIREFIGSGIPVAHNLPFDRRFFNAMFARNNQVQLSAAGIDTLALSRQLFPRLCIYPEGGGSHRLSNLMYHFGLQNAFANSHRARDDVMLLVEVYRHLQDYASGRMGITYPSAVTHGCPTCGAAMKMEFYEGERVLVCTKQPACSERLVV